jgi:hypothetical protein
MSLVPSVALIGGIVRSPTVSMATFMLVLDSSVANVSLPHIAGSFGAKMNRPGCYLLFDLKCGRAAHRFL